MENTAFGEALEAVGKFSLDERETLLVIVRRRARKPAPKASPMI